MSDVNKIFFKSKDGVRIVGVWNEPLKKTKKAIILAHGITVNKDEDGIFVSLVNQLQSYGFAVLRFDFRGHGESEGKSVEMTLNDEVSDLRAAVNYVLEKGYKKIGLLGASFGGGIATLYTSKNQNKLKCLCLWYPVLDYDHWFFNPTAPWRKEEKEQALILLKKQEWIKYGKREFLLGKNLFEEMKRSFPYKELQKIKIPMVIIHGDKDTHVSYEDSRKYVRKNDELITISGADHGFHEQPFDQQAIKETVSFFIKNL